MKSVPQNRRPVRPPPPPVEEDDDEFTDDEEFDEEFDEDEEEEEEDIGDLLVELLSHEDDNVCSAMLKVAKQLETTNRLLVKMLSANSPQLPPTPPTPKRMAGRRPRRPSVIVESSEEDSPMDLTEDDPEVEETEA